MEKRESTSEEIERFERWREWCPEAAITLPVLGGMLGIPAIIVAIEAAGRDGLRISAPWWIGVSIAYGIVAYVASFCVWVMRPREITIYARNYGSAGSENIDLSVGFVAAMIGLFWPISLAALACYVVFRIITAPHRAADRLRDSLTRQPEPQPGAFDKDRK